MSLKPNSEPLMNAVLVLKKNGISKSTVRRWTKAPNASRSGAQPYQGLIDAKVPSKRNDFRDENSDDHYHRAVVKYLRGMCFRSECVVYSEYAIT